MGDEITELSIVTSVKTIQMGLKNAEVVEKFRSVESDLGENYITNVYMNNIVMRSQDKKKVFTISSCEVAYVFLHERVK